MKSYKKRKRQPRGPLPKSQDYQDWYFARREKFGEVMSLETFIRLWTDSGKWEQRGNYAGAYRMYRIDKEIGHIEENVFIDQAPKYRKNKK